MLTKEILALVTALEGGKQQNSSSIIVPFYYPIVIGILPVKGYYFGLDATTTVAPCNTPPQISACSTNPTTPIEGEILPEQTIACGDTVMGDSTGGAEVNNGGLGFCGTATGNVGLWYK